MSIASLERDSKSRRSDRKELSHQETKSKVFISHQIHASQPDRSLSKTLV